MPYDLLRDLRDIYLHRALKPYGLTQLHQLQHALQCASQAEQAGATSALITAALLHDIGHMIHDLGEHPAASGQDDNHEERGASWLTWHFGPAVTEPVRLHVAAKRYLCARQSDYLARLAPDSQESLRLQGGAMHEAECEAFERECYADDAISLRLWDEAAKDPAAQPPDWTHFERFISEARQQSPATESVY